MGLELDSLKAYVRAAVQRHPAAASSYKRLVLHVWFLQTGNRRLIELTPRARTGKSSESYALIKVRISRSRRPEVAERQLQKLQAQLLKKEVSIFPLGGTS